MSTASTSTTLTLTNMSQQQTAEDIRKELSLAKKNVKIIEKKLFNKLKKKKFQIFLESINYPSYLTLNTLDNLTVEKMDLLNSLYPMKDADNVLYLIEKILSGDKQFISRMKIFAITREMYRRSYDNHFKLGYYREY